MFLRTERSGHIDTALHNTAALVIETQDAGYRIRSALCRFQGGSAFFLIADSSGLAALSCGEASGDESLLLHAGLRLGRSGPAMQIPDLISLVCRKCDGMNETVAAGGHPAVHTEGSGHISGHLLSPELFHLREATL